MANKILVPLGKNDRIGDIIPHLKEITQPGMSVVFLIQRPANGFKWLQAYCAIMQSGLEKPLAVRRMVESHSAQMNRHLAQQRVFHACEALHELGIKIAVETYTGSLRKALKSYALDGDVEFIVMRPGIGLRMASPLREAICFWRLAGTARYWAPVSVRLDAMATR